MKVTLCLTVYNRYDLLGECLASVGTGVPHLLPDSVLIIDNGGDDAKMNAALRSWPLSYEVVTPNYHVGLAEAWNWFIRSTPDGRILSSDDIVFAPHSIKALVEAEGEFVSPVKGASEYACFKIMDSCVDKVGYFDETISPGYLYFEDCDYTNRMREVGLSVTTIDCGVSHVGSATLKARTPEQTAEHHRRFLQAQSNFITKWGKLPEGVVAQA